MKLMVAVLALGLTSAPTTDFAPPTEQEVALLTSGMLGLTRERDLALLERDAAKQEVERLLGQLLGCP